MISRPASWYGGCRLNCTAGRPVILVAVSVTCSTSSTTRRSWCTRGERVSANKGAKTAGIDKATAAMIETQVGVVGFLGQIRGLLKSGEFRPVEVRQVMIPKGNTGKFRKL